MNNFKRPKNTSRPRPIEGIVPRQPQKPPTGSIAFNRPQSYRPNPTLIGDFKRPEGFQPAQQPMIPVDGQQAPITPQTPPLKFEGPLDLPAAPARKAPKHGKKRRTLKIIARSLASVMVVIVLGAGFLFGKAYWKSRHIFKGDAAGAAALQENVDPALLKGEGDGRVNLLIMGKGGAENDAPDLTDTMILASLDPVNKEVALMSIPRDLWVKVPNYGNMKINAAYATAKQNTLSSGKLTKELRDKAEKAGVESAQRTVEQTFGVPIHYYAMVDYVAFRQAIDTVGGITVDVKEQLYDASVAWENNNNPVIAQKGLQTFNGKKALLYARSRHGSARGDFDRAQRQREIMLALKDKVLSAGTLSNPFKIDGLLSAFGDHASTNLNRDEVMRIYSLMKDVPGNKITSVGLADPPNNFVTTDFINGQSVVVPRAGVGNFKDIQSYIRNTLKDSFIRNENATILVLNGTSKAGLATSKAEELKSFGYNIAQIADAPNKGYQKTVVVDMTNGVKKYTRHYLESRFKTSAATALPDRAIVSGNADFVIILGDNETTSFQN